MKKAVKKKSTMKAAAKSGKKPVRPAAKSAAKKISVPAKKVAAKKPAAKAAKSAPKKPAKPLKKALKVVGKSAPKKPAGKPVAKAVRSAPKKPVKALRKAMKVVAKSAPKKPVKPLKKATKVVAKNAPKKPVKLLKKATKVVAKNAPKKPVKLLKKATKVVARSVAKKPLKKIESVRKALRPVRATTRKTVVSDKVSSKAKQLKAALARKTSKQVARKTAPAPRPAHFPKTITRMKDLKTKAVKQLKPEKKAAKTAPVEVAAPVVRKPRLKADELRRLRAALEQERHRLLQEIRALDDHTLTDRLDEGNNHQPGYSQHLADSAADNQEMETALGIRSIEAEQLMAIDEALRSIEGGDYGICRRCGESISIERLLVKPMAQYCVPCRKLVETGKA